MDNNDNYPLGKIAHVGLFPFLSGYDKRTTLSFYYYYNSKLKEKDNISYKDVIRRGTQKVCVIIIIITDPVAIFLSLSLSLF